MNISREPLAVRGVVVFAIMSLVSLAVLFGVNITNEQMAGIEVALNAVSMAVLVIWTRGKVTPVDDPMSVDGTSLVPITKTFDD